MTDTMEEIKKKLLDGSPPAELIKSGYARSTVYAVVQQMRRCVQDTSVAMDANYPLLSVVSRLREDNKNLQQANLQLARQNGILQERVKTRKPKQAAHRGSSAIAAAAIQRSLRTMPLSEFHVYADNGRVTIPLALRYLIRGIVNLVFVPKEGFIAGWPSLMSSFAPSPTDTIAVAVDFRYRMTIHQRFHTACRNHGRRCFCRRYL